MNTPSWMISDAVEAPRRWVRRSRGRRSSDGKLNLETVLAVGVLLAWMWCLYELVLLFLK